MSRRKGTIRRSSKVKKFRSRSNKHKSYSKCAYSNKKCTRKLRMKGG